MINSGVKSLRDPCVIFENGFYYMCGSKKVDPKTYDQDIIWGLYKSKTLYGEWEIIDGAFEIPSDAATNFWAPEIHKYKGKFYLFATYKSRKTNRRGCAVFKSDSIEGKYKMITDGHFTPKSWDSIDATLYVDECGMPWSVFVHEWTSTDDNIGRMAAVRLSDDLSAAASEPIELFRADDPKWSEGRRVTDGCWLYKTKGKRLIMLWSNFSAFGYCVATAYSDNGKIDGKWIQNDNLLFTKEIFGGYEGGHGMIFKDENGKAYLSLHSPNNSACDGEETPIFIPVIEENDELKLKI